MKRNIILRVGFLLATTFFMITCTKPDIEKAREAYDPSQVIPVVQGISGAASVLQTFSFDYTLSYFRAGSTWSWDVTDGTITATSEDTRTITVQFETLPSSGKAVISVTETTFGGVTSEPKTKEVTVNPFCPLPISGFIGAWSGTDGRNANVYASQVVISASSDTQVLVDGITAEWIVDYWGETITAGGTFLMTINPNGTVVIPNQFLYTTDYNGDPYDYNISGSGNWGNCGTYPTLTLNYKLYNTTDDYSVSPFVATLVLDGKKGLVSTSNPSVNKSAVEEKAALKAKR